MWRLHSCVKQSTILQLKHNFDNLSYLNSTHNLEPLDWLFVGMHQWILHSGKNGSCIFNSTLKCRYFLLNNCSSLLLSIWMKLPKRFANFSALTILSSVKCNLWAWTQKVVELNSISWIIKLWSHSLSTISGPFTCQIHFSRTASLSYTKKKVKENALFL